MTGARTAGGRLLVISGIGGVGKSALATRWLSTQSLHNGGQLYVDFSGPEESIPSAVVLRRWIRAVGIGRPPATLGELTGLWRSVTATRAVDVLIDGATTPSQVRPLLPSGADSVTVVTSRTTLRELALDGAMFHQVQPFSQQAALQLLARLVGEEWIAVALSDALRLADACYRLPLPLVLAGARVASRPHHSVAATADALTRHAPLPHSHLEDSARMTINTALNEAYRALEEEHQRIYRWLSLLPVDYFDSGMIAAVCDLPEEHAEWGLESLTEAQLLEQHPAYVPAPVEATEEQEALIRYRMGGVARDHARSLVVEHDGEEDRVLVLRRLCEWILAIATQAQFRLTAAQATLRRSLMVPLPAVESPFDDDAGALSWLESYESSLLGVLKAAEHARWDDLAWQLVDAFWPLFLRRHPYELWIQAHEIALAAARRLHNEPAVRQMLASGAIGLSAAGRRDEAIDWYAQALEAARAHNDVRDEGQALLGLGACHYEEGRPSDASPFLDQAIAVWESCGYGRGVALAMIVQGQMALADQPGRALNLFIQARTMMLDADDSYEAIRALVLQGHARVRTGDFGAGTQEMESALAALTAAGSTQWQARALELLGDAYRAAARSYYQRAAEAYLPVRWADAERVTALAVGL
ncbi:hypothetical protein ACH4Y0_03135 [Streptomyces sp. NPDC020707]|uniref:hypothetical protein n=1 Tax=Streptomyces sp. NPDC020707 TaxID=3365084 RepID=UPI0037B24D18